MAEVRVCLRCRPTLPIEDSEPGVTIEGTNIIVHDVRHRADYQRYYFDNVFGPRSTSTQIFDELLHDNIPSLFAGASSTVFLHGATSSGKTHTAEGTPHEVGLVELSMAEIFRCANEPDHRGRYKVSYALFEIHCDKVRDLLGSKSDLPMRVNHLHNMTIEGLQWKVADEPDAEALAYQSYREGVMKRRVARTRLNNESSRSHCCLHFRVELMDSERSEDFVTRQESIAMSSTSNRGSLMKDIVPRVCSHIELPPSKQVGNFFVIDLAGAENNSKTGNVGAQLEESCSINSNHFQLGQVLSALKQKKKQIPYRNSKMTRLLRSCFQERGYTLMLVTISPSASSLQATLNSFKTIALDGTVVPPSLQSHRPYQLGNGVPRSISSSARPLTSMMPRMSSLASPQVPNSARSSSCGASARYRRPCTPTRSESCGPNGRVRPSTNFQSSPSAESVRRPCVGRRSEREDRQLDIAEKRLDDERREKMAKEVWESVQAQFENQIKTLNLQMATHQQALDQVLQSKVTSMIHEKTGNMTLSLLNYGTVWDLTRLKGIDQDGATAIITHRLACGPFNAVDDVLAVASLSESAREIFGERS